MKPILSVLFTTAGLLSATAAGTVEYSVNPHSTYPADGASVTSVQRIRVNLDRGFGPVGFNPAADGMNVWLEDESGNKIMLINAVNSAPCLNSEWNLTPLDGNDSPDVHTYKDRLYDALFTRSLGWNGGDGVFTVGLPGGHAFWTFNDSFYGVADPVTRARGACSFPRNTIMVQRADADAFPVTTDDALLWLARFKQTTRPNSANYYKALTHLDHPLATSFNTDGIAQDFLYWSGDGTVTDGKLQMLWNAVDNRNGQMIALGTALATYSLEGEPGDKSYLALESVNHDYIPDNPYTYGSTLWEDPDGHIYLYSATNNGTWLGNDPIVARTTEPTLDSEIEYYIADEAGNFSWQKDYPTQEQVQRSGIAPQQGSFTLPWVFKKGNRYFMCAQTFPFGQEMAIMIGEHPWGPFTEKKILMKFPNPLDELQHDPWGDKYRFLYMLNLHPALSRNGELVISTNTDATDDGPGTFWRNFNEPGSCDWYRPFFFRIYGWENLFEGTMAGASDCIEFIPADPAQTIVPGRYKFVCEPGVFGNELFETENFESGKANNRIEINFTVTGESSLDRSAVDASCVDATYHNLQGLTTPEPTPGNIYIVRRGSTTSKEVAR